MLPVSPARRALFNPAYVQFEDQPATVAVAEADPGGAVTIDFDVTGPSITVLGKAGGSIYWLSNQRCADGAIVLFCGDKTHVHLVELKQTINAKSWKRIKTQFDGMLANVDAVLGTARLTAPETITCYVAFANDNLAASPVLSKVINTTTGPHALVGAEWASGIIDLLDYAGVPVKKIRWGSGPTAIVCP